ncbi:MAG: glycosyltransferase family 2 protein [Mucilaginibacter polytrichastri]|nr:glycosyltransferase family 2 protein [Mucilaginibacter polytrichastri]
MIPAPIALFVYNRPEHTRRTLDTLKKNNLAEDSRLYIFSDAPKTAADASQVQAVRSLIRETTGFRSVQIIEQKENKGLANSIIDGVTQICRDYGRVIVMEDDLLSSPFLLEYFNDALQRYEKEERVMHIGAYMYPLSDASHLPETFFYRAATSWGWATWARAWQHFNPDIDLLMSRFDKKAIHRFSIGNSMNFWKQMQQFKAGKNNSWAIRWYASIFLRGGLTLNPAQSLVNNIGHDGSGTHSGTIDVYTVNVRQTPVRDFPDALLENPQAYAAIRNFLTKRKGSYWERGLRFLRQRFGR